MKHTTSHKVTRTLSTLLTLTLVAHIAGGGGGGVNLSPTAHAEYNETNNEWNDINALEPITAEDFNAVANRSAFIDENGNWLGSATNLVGPQGPQGDIGPTGPTGPAGPAGPAGTDGDDGALAGLTCSSGQVVMFNGSNWVCTSSVNGKWSDGATSGDIVYTGGNVGIGTDSPAASLEINSYEDDNLLIHSASATGWSRIALTREGETDHGFLGYHGTNSHGTSSGMMLGATGEHVIRFHSNGNDQMTIYPSGDVSIPYGNLSVSSGDLSVPNGNVGIGTSSPVATLDVNGSFMAANEHVYSSIAYNIGGTYDNEGAAILEWKEGTTILDRGHVYKVQVSIDGDTGFPTSATYLVRDNSLYTREAYSDTNNLVDDGIPEWEVRTVNDISSGFGQVLEVIMKDGATPDDHESQLQLSSDYSSPYAFRYIVTAIETNNNNVHYGIFGADGIWQRSEADAYYLDGNVGIGTTSPESELHVEGDIIANFVSGKNILPFQYASWEIANDGDRIETVGQWNTSATISTDYSFDGTRSIKQVTTHVNDSGNTDGYVYYSLGRPNYNIPIKPSTKYILSAYAKASSEEAINVQLYASIDDIYQSHYPGYQSVTDEWVRISNVFTTQASADALMIRTDIDSLASDGSATVYFDAFMLEEAAPGQTEPSAWTPSMASHGIGVSSTGQLAINTVNPDSLLHIKSSPRQNSINRVCPAGTLWASFFDGDTGYDWNADDILDGRDYGVLAGIDTNDYLEDNECVVFGTSTGNAAGATPAAGEFWIDTDRDRKVDAGEIITGVTTTLNGDAVVAASPNKCEDGYVWLNQRVDAGDEPVAGECIAPIVDANNTPTISRVDFINGVCPAGTNARDNNGDGNIDDDECHVPALSVGHGGAKIGENYESLTTLPPINGLLVEGNVGVGTTSPGAKLDVRSGSISAGIQHDNSNRYGLLGYRNIDNSDSSALGGYAMESESGIESPILFGYDAGANYDNKIRFSSMTTSDRSLATGLQDRMVIDMTSGNVGIGTTEPRAKLEIASDGEEDNDLLIHSKTTGAVGSLADWARISLMREGETDEGFLGFYGTNSAGTSSGLMLGVSGEHVIRFNTNGGDKMLIYPNGDVGIAGNATANGVLLDSDSRYKKEIQTLPSALKNILSLRGVSYYWKDRDDNTQQIGVIAQEVEKIYPQLVHTNEDGYKSVAYANLVSPLIEAVKELHALYQGHADRLAALEAQNAELETQNAHQDERIAHQDELIVQLEVRLAALEAAQ